METALELVEHAFRQAKIAAICNCVCGVSTPQHVCKRGACGCDACAIVAQLRGLEDRTIKALKRLDLALESWKIDVREAREELAAEEKAAGR